MKSSLLLPIFLIVFVHGVTSGQLHAHDGHRCLSDIIQTKVKVNVPSDSKLPYEATLAADHARVLQTGVSEYKPIRIHLDYSGEIFIILFAKYSLLLNSFLSYKENSHMSLNSFLTFRGNL